METKIDSSRAIKSTEGDRMKVNDYGKRTSERKRLA